MVFTNYEQHPTVLVIDDDEDDRELVRSEIELRNSNFIVKLVESGTAGFSFLKKAKQAGDLPCLIILDLNMPGMDGKEVLMQIKKDFDLAAIPLVIFTTSSSDLDKNFAGKEGVEIITKPTTYENFTKAVERLLSYC